MKIIAKTSNGFLIEASGTEIQTISGETPNREYPIGNEFNTDKIRDMHRDIKAFRSDNLKKVATIATEAETLRASLDSMK